jgi:hypothetical protein
MMTTFVRKFVAPLLLVALTSTGCVIATGDTKRAEAPAGSAGGAAQCQLSTDGKMVACGGMATYCQQSSDGHAVACGGMATYCQKSGDGTAVACGGRANYCDRSADGKQVACGGA